MMMLRGPKIKQEFWSVQSRLLFVFYYFKTKTFLLLFEGNYQIVQSDVRVCIFFSDDTFHWSTASATAIATSVSQHTGRGEVVLRAALLPATRGSYRWMNLTVKEWLGALCQFVGVANQNNPRSERQSIRLTSNVAFLAVGLKPPTIMRCA